MYSIIVVILPEKQGKECICPNNTSLKTKILTTRREALSLLKLIELYLPVHSANIKISSIKIQSARC